MIYIPNKKKYNKVFFSVPKKNFKKAVNRNEIKRKILESYRKNKKTFYKKKKFFLIGYIYNSNKKQNFWKIKEKINESLNYLINFKKVIK